MAHAATVAERELAAIVDNPVVLPSDGRVESNGNFHGAPVAYVLDFLAIAAADLGSIAERRTDRMLDVARSHGLPPFLADDPGVDSGLMIAQYTQAALVSREQAAGRRRPAWTPSRPRRCRRTTSPWAGPPRASCALAGQPAPHPGRRAAHRGPRASTCAPRCSPRPGHRARPCARCASAGVGGPGPDRFLSTELRAAEDALKSGAVVAAVEAAVGALN